MRPTGQSLRIWFVAVLCALVAETPRLVSSQADTRSGASPSRSSSHSDDVQSSEARGTRGTREMDARGNRLGAEEHAEVEDQHRRDLTDDPDLDSVDEHVEREDGEVQEEEGAEPKDLPGSQEGNSSVTPQAISLPTAEGSTEGMGESFTPVLSTGTATFNVPIELPEGRAGVQPLLGLSYSSGSGNGVVGIGWGMGSPFISRQTDRGLPRYDDRAAWHPQEDRFIYNGGQELVPVDSEVMARVDASGIYDVSITAAVPAEVAGWQQYRARVEGGFMRFFRSPDGRRWVVQGKDGTRFDFGEIPDMTGPQDLNSTYSLQSEDGHGQGRIFQWYLTRMSDSHGSTVYYRYTEHLGSNYLEDIYYLSPNSCADSGHHPDVQRVCRAPLTEYAGHVAITYDSNRPDRFSSYASGWRTEIARRVRIITVTMAEGEVGTRYLVRRYHLSYDAAVHHSLLTSVQMEGRPDAPLSNAPEGVLTNTLVPENSLGIFGPPVGSMLPAITFEYSQMPAGTVAGFGGVDNRVTNVQFGPDVSVDLADADLFDVNTDGLPDVIVTEPARYRTGDGQPAAGVYFNGFTGEDTAPAARAGVFSEPVPVPMRGDLGGIMRLRNANIVPMDVDGDGRGDLLHMPRLDSYGYFTPTREADETVDYSVRPAQQGWRFTYSEVSLDQEGQDPLVDLVRDGAHYKMWDVNNDHLVDLVRTTGTAMETWMNLGWAPGGEGRFGHATFDETAGAWMLSPEPIQTCRLHDGDQVDFSDPQVRMADMNGDGIQDIVRIRRGRLVYWAGRGEALWGDGPPTCGQSEVGTNRERHVQNAPPELNPELAGVFMADVNADGLSDVVQVRFNQLDVWFNVNGERFTARQIFASPFAPDFSPNIRFTDIDGSGTTDLVYGRAEQWKYMDLLGGVRPRLLTRVNNGLGATTILTYASAAEDYTRDLQEADLCPGDCNGDEFQWSQVGPPRGQTLADPGPGGAECPWGDQQLLRLSGECVYRSGGSPVLSTVVRGVATTDNFSVLQLAGVGDNVTRSEFHYHEGYYEGIEQEFRGFGAADASALGDSHHGSQHTRTFFHQGRRPSHIATERLAENPYEVLKGRQWYTETFDDAGAYLATAHGTVVARNLVTGQDGRGVWYAYVSQTDEFRYHHDQFVRADTVRDLPWLAFEEVNSEGEAVATGATNAWSIPLRSATFAHVRGTTDNVDNVGNVLQQTAHGRLQDEYDSAPTEYDETTVSHSTPTLLTGGRWLWRMAESYVTGTGDGGYQLGYTQNFYNAITGDLNRTLARADLGGAPAYQFAGDPGFPYPEAYTIPSTQYVESSTRYDAWGSPVATCASGDLHTEGATNCLRYGEMVYDVAFAQVPTSERIAVHRDTGAGYCAGTTQGATGFCLIATTAIWDRGFGVLKQATDSNARTTAVAYDGLARLTAVVPPQAEGCTMDGVPVQTFEYTFGVGGLPLRRIRARQNHGNAGCSAPVYLEGVAYVDGLGRARVELARRGDTEWERSGVGALNARGTEHKSYQNDLLDSATIPPPSEALATPSSRFTEALYDAFGRVIATFAEDGSETATYYGATSNEVCDALDLTEGDERYSGTCAITRVDGRGRIIDRVLHQRRESHGYADEFYRLFTAYRADGAVTQVMRAETVDASPRDPELVGNHLVLRTFTYDTLGRRIGTTDPDSDSRNTAKDATNRSWRYLFNDVGNLAAVRDPRGCGQNFYYDHAGRLIGEAAVRCPEAMTPGNIPDARLPSSAIGMQQINYTQRHVDVRYFFDEEPDFDVNAPPAMLVNPHWVGRMSGMIDRAQRSVMVYDERGQVVATARQMAVMPQARPLQATLLPTLAGSGAIVALPAPYHQFDEEHTYIARTTYDYLGRPIAMEYPEDPDWIAMGGAGMAPTVSGTLHYNQLGLPTGVDLHVSQGTTLLHSVPIVRNVQYNQHRLATRTDFGDDSVIGALYTENEYDLRLRPTSSLAVRTPNVPANLSTRPLNAVSVVHDFRYEWDAASNLTSVTDARVTDEWPSGYRPWSQTVRHDALYRVNRIDYSYANDDNDLDILQADAATDWRVQQRTQTNLDGSTHAQADPMRRRPAPMISDNGEHRVRWLEYDYDWLANMTSWEDDDDVFYERSAGALTNGTESSESAGAFRPLHRPSALYLSTNIRTSTTGGYQAGVDRGGYVWLDYGESGNVTQMTVRSQCVDANPTNVCSDAPSGTFTARHNRLKANCVCQEEQHYRYDWDHVNLLREARRYDRHGGSGLWHLMVQQRYRYDSGNVRLIKETVNFGNDGAAFAATALSPYPGDFERRGLELDTVGNTYHASTDLGTETQYMVGGARLVWGTNASASTRIDREQRLTLPLSDLVQSTAAVVDLLSGDLIEHSTFYPNGALETHRATEDTSLQLEPIGFTGKEADEEVGVVYFGQRYLISRLGRWASVDPLSVHAVGGGEALNGYHYLGGSPLQKRDPLGLDETVTHLTPIPKLPSIAATGLRPNTAIDAPAYLGTGVYANSASTPFATMQVGSHNGSAALEFEIDTTGFREISRETWAATDRRLERQARIDVRGSDRASILASYRQVYGQDENPNTDRLAQFQHRVLQRQHWDNVLAGAPGAFVDFEDRPNTPGGRLFVIRDTSRVRSPLRIAGVVQQAVRNGRYVFNYINRRTSGFRWAVTVGGQTLGLTLLAEIIPGSHEAMFFAEHGGLNYVRGHAQTFFRPVVAPVTFPTWIGRALTTPIIFIAPQCTGSSSRSFQCPPAGSQL